MRWNEFKETGKTDKLQKAIKSGNNELESIRDDIDADEKSMLAHVGIEHEASNDLEQDRFIIDLKLERYRKQRAAELLKQRYGAKAVTQKNVDKVYNAWLQRRRNEATARTRRNRR
jgi:hypothetical protein